MKVRWKRVMLLVAVLILVIWWPRLRPVVMDIDFPDVVPVLFPNANDHDAIRTVIAAAIVALGTVLVIKEITHH